MNVGVGGVLSQWVTTDQKHCPCTYFSHRLLPVERNYNIGNHDLLAVKLELEQWRHWLEGAKLPFLVWNDHRNVQYISAAKRLNPCKARLALIFTQFYFSLSYCPRSRNAKPVCGR